MLGSVLRILGRVIATLATLVAALGALAVAGPQVAYAADGHPAEWGAVAALFTLSIVAAWLGLWAAGGRNPFGHRPAALRGRRPRRFALARAALGYAAVVSCYLLYGLAASLTWSFVELTSAATLLALIGGGIYGAVTLVRPRGSGRVAVLFLGAYAALSLPFLFVRLAKSAPPNAGPAFVVSWLLAGGVLVALVAAALIVVSVRDEWPLGPTADAAA